MKYRAIKDITEKGWENESGEIKAGDILDCRNWYGIPTIMLSDNRAVCDEDSQMAKDLFELVEE